MKNRILVVPALLCSVPMLGLLWQQQSKNPVSQGVKSPAVKPPAPAGVWQPAAAPALQRAAYRPASPAASGSRPGASQTSKPLQGAAAIVELKKRGQYASLMGAVKHAMYGFKPSKGREQGKGSAFGAANAQQNFAAHFDGRGVRVQTTKGDNLRLQWQSVQREGERVQSIAPATPTLSGEELQLRRAGATEWFRNGAEGLEQGFTLHQKPAGKGQEVRLTLAASGLRAQNQKGKAGKERINLLDDEGKTALTYSKLKVWDADGKILPARMEAKEGRILLAMRDSGARYPLTVDPLIATQQAYLKASNTDFNDNFGNSVAISGESVVVGAPFEASNATGVNGNEADNSASFAGAAYVFVRSGGPSGTWSQQAYLKASNTEGNDRFGYSVAIDGESLVVGAYNEASNASGVNGNQADNSAGGAGAAYVFVRSGGPSGTWSQQAYLKASNTDAGDNFGTSVAIDGESLVVGAYQEASNASGVNGNQADNSAGGAGAAYVFVRNGGPSGTWSQQAYLKASNTATNDQFGTSVAISGESVVVGAPLEASNATGANGNQADNSAPNAGAAYVFVRSGGPSGTWSQQAYLKASNPEANDLFGYSVAMDGESVVVGALYESSNAIGVNGNGADNSASESGAAYVFVRSGGLTGTWSQQAYLKASNTDAGDNFGWSVAIDGESVVVGAPFEASNATGANGNQADNSATNAGAAYVFVRSGGLTGTWSQQAYLKASNTGDFDNFGRSVAIDGESVVIGAPYESSNATGVNGDQTDNSTSAAGAAYVFTLLPDPAQAGPNFEVNTTDDTTDGTCGEAHCSLREAIIAANDNADASTISFDETVFASAQTILLTSALDNLSSDLTIDGPASGVTIQRSSGGNYSILVVNSSTVELSKLTLSNGQNDADGGGGLLNYGTVTLTDCTISGNSSTYAGGGLLNNGGSSMTLSRCTISGNTCNTNAGYTGGGIDSNNGTLSLTNCTFSGNSASDGGQGHVGGALWLNTTATIDSCTFTNNSADGTDSTGGIRVEGGTATIGNSIVAGNSGINGATPDVSGTFTSTGYNLIGATDGSTGFTASGDQTGTTANPLDAKLGTLSNNGGLTQTIPLQGGSPAIDTGNTAETTDQRGIARPQGSADDIGAYEAGVINVATTSVTEGNGGSVNLVFTLTLSAPTSQTVTVDVAAAPGSTFPATGGGVDYDDYSTTVTFAAGETTKTVNIGVNGDTLDEFNERVALVLSNATNAVIGTVNEGVIIDNDPAPSISINDVQVTETNGGSAQAVFTLTLSAASAKPITVIANTNSLGGSPAATPGTDYNAVTNATVTFAPGQTTRPFNVTILGDVSDEQDEKFGVRLTSAVNATIADNSAVGTILDNDNPPVITGQGGNITEGDGNDAFIFYSFNLSAPSGKNISLSFKTISATTNPATAGTDYTPVPAMTVTIPAGSSGFAYPIAIKGDLLDEVNERIGVQLSNVTNATIGTLADIVIIDNDATPSLSIADAQTTEGDSGTKLLTFTVTLSAASGQTVTVNAASSGGGSPAATAGTDYVALASTPISFAPGQTSKQISITINGDTTVEANEKLGVVLSGAVGATIADNSAIGTILNDDPANTPAPAQSPEDDDSK